MKSQKDRTRNSAGRRCSSRIICLASSCCILVCFFLLSTMCWAWFTSSTTASFEVQTAIYGARVTIVKQGTTIADQQIISTHGDLWELENGYVYDVKITATGNADTGHCKIILPGGTRNTGNLSSGSELQFQINLTGGGTTWLQILSSWGAYNAYYDGAPIAPGEVLTEGPVQLPPEPEQTPTEEAEVPDATDETESEAETTETQPTNGGSTEQLPEDGTQSADTGTEPPAEGDTQTSDSP